MTITTPMMKMTPDFTPVARVIAMQTRMAGQSSETMMRLAMLPWNSLSAGMTALKSTPAAKPASKSVVKSAATPAAKTAAKSAPAHVAEPAAKAVAPVVASRPSPAKVTPVAQPPVAAKTEAAKTEAKIAAPAQSVVALAAPKPVAVAKKTESAPEKNVATNVAPTQPAPIAAAKVETAAQPNAEVKSDAKVAATNDADKPEMLKAARNGKADDLTLLKGVGPKLALALQEAGIYHYDQIAEWTDVQTAWVDENIAGVRGRASRNDWVEQALELATA